jgi:hypothetical protein|tara:strand:+ start:1480 stop:1746 length:267 start_codon:yes stop_codon:yes gene_type:complete
METEVDQPVSSVIDDILDKDNVNANEKIYNALYGKSSEYITARKAQIARTMFNGPDQEQPDVDAYDEVEPIVQDNESEDTEEQPEEQP